MTINIISILEELNEMMSKVREKANQVPSFTEEASYYKGQTDALMLAWEVVFKKAYVKDELEGSGLYE
ncbi:MAG TPA: hypothetical protein DD811_01770 [Syntrophomonas sp.]|jgi:hypothetical protein|nr:hypothetical protein [Syntrophomonas sp.]